MWREIRAGRSVPHKDYLQAPPPPSTAAVHARRRRQLVADMFSRDAERREYAHALVEV